MKLYRTRIIPTGAPATSHGRPCHIGPALMPEKPAPPLVKALIVSHVFGPFDGQVRGYIPQGRDRNAEGHFLPGPVRARPITARLVGGPMAEPSARDARADDGVLTPAPHVARQRMRARRAERRRILDRHARFLAAVRGEPVGRNRKAA